MRVRCKECGCKIRYDRESHNAGYHHHNLVRKGKVRPKTLTAYDRLVKSIKDQNEKRVLADKKGA